MGLIIPEPIEKTLNLPWHLTKGVANLAAYPVRLLLNDQYVPDTGKPKDGEDTVYQVVDPMLDYASIIYYYTELRSETKKRLEAFGARKFAKVDVNVKDVLNILRNAMKVKQSRLENLNEIVRAPDDSFQFASAEYGKSLKEFDNLKTRFKLTDGDIEVLEAYFHILKEPKSYADIKGDIELYNNYISPEFRFAFAGKDFNLSTITDMVNRDPTAYIKKIDDDFVTTSLTPGGFLNGLESELVYTIAVSKAAKRVTVAFRGSVNANDWVTNFNQTLVDFKLPGYTSKAAEVNDFRESHGRVHEGFYNYLFGKTQLGRNGSNKSKAEEIMGILTTLFKKECKGYSLFVTGHSLGGALSTLFAFRAAYRGELSSMVTNVSFASPYAGDQGFRNHFYDLEKDNKIRHIRVSNDEDAVPLVPFVAPGIPGLSLGPIPELETYKHTGMNIRLYNKEQMFMPKVRVFYPKKGSWPNEIRNAVLNSLPTGLSVGVINKHLCPEYLRRVSDAKEVLEKITVEGLYSNTHLTGWSYTPPDK